MREPIFGNGEIERRQEMNLKKNRIREKNKIENSPSRLLK